MPFKYSNFARAKLATPPAGTTGLTFTIESGKGALFPPIPAGSHAVLVFKNKTKASNEAVLVEARAGDSFTIAAGGRGFDGTTAQVWTTNDYVELALLKANLENFVQKDEGPIFTQGVTVQDSLLREDQGADIPSGTTVNLGAATGNYVHITHSAGSTAITSLGGATLPAGTRISVRFGISGGTLSLTHSLSLILPRSVNINVAHGDMAVFRKLHDSNAEWVCESYTWNTQAGAFSAIVAGGGVVTGQFSVPAPTLSGHAANKSYVDGEIATLNASIDSTKASLTGASFSGAVSVPAPTLSGHAATKGYVDGALASKASLTGATFSGSVSVPTPTLDGHAATKGYVDTAVASSSGGGGAGTGYVAKTGDTMTGQLTLTPPSGQYALNAAGNNQYGIYATNNSASHGAMLGYCSNTNYYGIVGFATDYSFVGVGRMQVTGTASDYAIRGLAGGAGVGAVRGDTQNGAFFGILGHANSYAFYGQGAFGLDGNATINGALGISGYANVGATLTSHAGSIAALNSALAGKANLTGATFTGLVSVPTPSSAAHAATKGYVDGQISTVNAAIVGKANLSGASFSGAVNVQPPSAGTNATTKTYVDAGDAAVTALVAGKATLNANYDWLEVYSPGTNVLTAISLPANFGHGVFMLWLEGNQRFNVITDGGGQTINLDIDGEGDPAIMDKRVVYSCDIVRASVGGIVRIYKLRKL